MESIIIVTERRVRPSDVYSESRAAVAGGITSYMDMPNTQPTTTRLLMEDKFSLAAGRSFANYSFYLGGTNDNIGEIMTLDPQPAGKRLKIDR